MFLQACLNGSRPPGDHEALPLTPEELARDALEVAEAGAVAVHVHPRGPDGLESLEPEHCDAAVAALRDAAPELALLAARRAARGLQRRARRGRGRALPQAIRLTASSAATL
jgi:uncharacterized protein (DUF849 family)